MAKKEKPIKQNINTTTQAATAAAAAAGAVLANDISYIKSDIAEIKQSLRDLSNEYVTRAEFDPIKKVVYGVIGILGLAVIGAVLQMILVKK